MAGRLALVAALVATGTALGGGSSGPWRPHVWAAERYAAQRHGVIAFAVRTRTRSWGWHRTTTFPSASVVKAMLLVAYLDLPSVRRRRLRPADGALLVPMIRHSDNDAASKVLSIVGSARVYDVARRARMRRFTLVTGYWGLSRIDAADQARFFTDRKNHIDGAARNALLFDHAQGFANDRNPALVIAAENRAPVGA